MNEQRYGLKFAGWGFGVLALVCCLCLAHAVGAREDAKEAGGVLISKPKDEARTEEAVEEGQVTAKQVTGKVSAVSSRFIAVSYRKDAERGVEHEMALPIDKSARDASKTVLEKLRVGDMVTVSYDEIVKPGKGEKEGEEKIERKARLITVARGVVRTAKTGGSEEEKDAEVPGSYAKVFKKLGATDAEARYMYNAYKKRDKLDALKRELAAELKKKAELEKAGKKYRLPGKEGG
jgi:hypothetical protein